MGCKDNFSFCYSFKNRNNVFFFYFFTYSFFLRTFLFANSEMDINNSEALSFWMRYLMQMLYPKLLYIVSFLIYSTEVWLVIWNNICCFPGKWYLIILVQSRPVVSMSNVFILLFIYLISIVKFSTCLLGSC